MANRNAATDYMCTASYIWSCLKCRIADTKPQTCEKCNGYTQLTLKCSKCGFAFNKPRSVECENDIGCYRTFNILEPLESVLMREEKRLNNIFLASCTNFNSIQQNLMFLIYGYLHFKVEYENINLYNTIPSEILDICIIFCYDVDKLDLVRKYTLYKTNNSGSLDWSIYLYLNINCLARRIWRIKITDHNPKDNIMMNIGLRKRRNSKICGLKELTVINLKVGDIISILCIMSSDASYVQISYVVNHQLFKPNEFNQTQRALNDSHHQQCMTISMYSHEAELALLQ